MRNVFKKKVTKIIAGILATIILIPSLLEIGTLLVGALWHPWTPNYEKTNIEYILDKAELSDVDYELLFKQTGLSRIGVDGLIASGRKYDILEIQEKFFESTDYYYDVFAPFTGLFKTEDSNYCFAALENGDILFCPGSYFSFLRLGHISIVTDRRFRIAAEAQGYENDYELVYASDFLAAPAYMILRPKAGLDIREAAAEYAKKELYDIKYAITAGILTQKLPEKLEYTHCSHMIWYVYKKLGIDIDSNGGIVITPQDIANSSNVEIVQVFGIDIENFINNDN